MIQFFGNGLYTFLSLTMYKSDYNVVTIFKVMVDYLPVNISDNLTTTNPLCTPQSHRLRPTD